jgi:hypothetical protein
MNKRFVTEMKWYRTFGTQKYFFLAGQNRLDNGDYYQYLHVYKVVSDRIWHTRPVKRFTRVVKVINGN